MSDITKVYSLDGQPEFSFPLTGAFFWTMGDDPLQHTQVKSRLNMGVTIYRKFYGHIYMERKI